jgi:hypothetical protein
MSNSSSLSAGISTRGAGPVGGRRSGHLAVAGEGSIGGRGWDERVGREVQHQELVEATFDRAEAYARLGDFERAVEWLDRAAALGGDLPPTFQVKRALWDRRSALRLRPAGAAAGR